MMMMMMMNKKSCCKYLLSAALEHHQQRQSCVDQVAAIHPLQSPHQTDSMVGLEPFTQPRNHPHLTAIFPLNLGLAAFPHLVVILLPVQERTSVDKWNKFSTESMPFVLLNQQHQKEGHPLVLLVLLGPFHGAIASVTRCR